MGCHFLFQRIFPIQGSNLHLLPGQVYFLALSHLGSPYYALTYYISTGYRINIAYQNVLPLFKKKKTLASDFSTVCFLEKKFLAFTQDNMKSTFEKVFLLGGIWDPLHRSYFVLSPSSFCPQHFCHFPLLGRHQAVSFHWLISITG